MILCLSNTLFRLLRLSLVAFPTLLLLRPLVRSLGPVVWLEEEYQKTKDFYQEKKKESPRRQRICIAYEANLRTVLRYAFDA